jgi:hypothetical protein
LFLGRTNFLGGIAAVRYGSSGGRDVSGGWIGEKWREKCLGRGWMGEKKEGN